MRQAPFRPGREKIAHTLVYEARLIGDLALPPDLLPGAFAAAPDAKAAALILTGSGPLDRDSTGPRFRGEIGLEIARVLASHSVGSLRYDKPGAGQSEGDYFDAGLSDNYSYACAATDWLGDRCPGLLIYVIGHSEGALHAAHLAAEAKVAGAVLIACPARRGEEILTWQAVQILPTLSAATRAVLKGLRLDPLKSQRKAFARQRSTYANAVRIQGKRLNARWLRQFMDYDPLPIFSRIQAPLLLLVGEHDMQVPPEDVETRLQLEHLSLLHHRKPPRFRGRPPLRSRGRQRLGEGVCQIPGRSRVKVRLRRACRGV
jgi:pimeloyl-ACP methyl ester carboxylesterase